MTLDEYIELFELPTFEVTVDTAELLGICKELKEAKRLLRLAVEDLRYLESHTVDEEGGCLISDRGKKILCSDCPFNNGGKVNEKCVWNYETEALALIGKDIDVPVTDNPELIGGSENAKG